MKGKDKLIEKWKILDFMPPKLGKNRGDDYSYEKHYPGGKNIFYSFKIGNVSHTYDSKELNIINKLLSEKNAGKLWLQVAKNLIDGSGRNKTYIAIDKALDRAFEDIGSFMKKNTKVLNIKEKRLNERMDDLILYKKMIKENFDKLCEGISQYSKEQPSKNKKIPSKQEKVKKSEHKVSLLFPEKKQPKNSADIDSDSGNNDEMPDPT